MKATELRIGNLVQYTLFGIMPIRNGYDIDSFIENAGQPIPLTDEWLLKFGAENIYHQRYSLPDGTIVILNQNPNESHAVQLNGEIVTYKTYVHEIQNFYFDLNGVELNVKL